MLGHVAIRIVTAGLVVLTVISLVFFLIQLSGDPLDALVPPGATADDRAVLAERYGLDESLLVQYRVFLGNAVTGDFGVSWRSEQPALEMLIDRLPVTLGLVGGAFLLATLVALPVGLLAGSRPGGIADVVSAMLAIGGQAVPAFWLGTMLILLFAVRFDIFPPSGSGSLSAYVLPVVSLAAYPVSVLTRLLRVATLEELQRDYVRTARSKGVDERAILLGHVLQNALGPFVAYIGVMVGFLIGSAIAVESVFALPGAGSLALQSVGFRDLPVVNAFVAVVAVIIVLANLLADLMTIALDPVVRESEPQLAGAAP